MNIPALFRSSTDPESISLTIKSILAFAVFFGIEQTTADEIGGFITQLIVAIGMAIPAFTGLWGIVRKIKLGRWSAPN